MGKDSDLESLNPFDSEPPVGDGIDDDEPPIGDNTDQVPENSPANYRVEQSRYTKRLADFEETTPVKRAQKNCAPPPVSVE